MTRGELLEHWRTHLADGRRRSPHTVRAYVATAARLLNQPFRKHARTGRPLVTLKSAVTLDGRTATAGGESRWISSPASPRISAPGTRATSSRSFTAVPPARASAGR